MSNSKLTTLQLLKFALLLRIAEQRQGVFNMKFNAKVLFVTVAVMAAGVFCSAMFVKFVYSIVEALS